MTADVRTRIVVIEPELQPGLVRRAFRITAEGFLEWTPLADWVDHGERARFYGYASKHFPSSINNREASLMISGRPNYRRARALFLEIEAIQNRLEEARSNPEASSEEIEDLLGELSHLQREFFMTGVSSEYEL